MSSSTVNVVRSALAGHLQSAQFMGKPLPKLPNSTLNQKLGIKSEIDISSEEMPVCRYITIGNGGHKFVVGANGRPKWTAVHHTTRHTAMYNQLPFVLRQVTNDLTQAERAKYRLRRVEEHNGIQYIAYYARVLDLTDTAVNMELRHVENGTTTSTLYAPTIEDLNPVPPNLVAGESVSTTGDYIATSVKVPFTMTAEEIKEFQDAIEIIEGETGYASISEICTVAGVDRVVTDTIAGQSQQYEEVIRAQIMSFISTAFVTEFMTDGIKMMVDVGNVEPLLTVQTN